MTKEERREVHYILGHLYNYGKERGKSDRTFTVDQINKAFRFKYGIDFIQGTIDRLIDEGGVKETELSGSGNRRFYLTVKGIDFFEHKYYLEPEKVPGLHTERYLSDKFLEDLKSDTIPTLSGDLSRPFVNVNDMIRQAKKVNTQPDLPKKSDPVITKEVIETLNEGFENGKKNLEELAATTKPSKPSTPIILSWWGKFRRSTTFKIMKIVGWIIGGIVTVAKFIQLFL